MHTHHTSAIQTLSTPQRQKLTTPQTHKFTAPQRCTLPTPQRCRLTLHPAPLEASRAGEPPQVLIREPEGEAPGRHPHPTRQEALVHGEQALLPHQPHETVHRAAVQRPSGSGSTARGDEQ